MDDTSLFGQDRRPLDNRRLAALLLDGLLFAPIHVVAYLYDVGAQALALTLFFVYHFLCEATTGQTVGKAVCRLRVVTVDGAIPSTGAVVRRTLLRGLDETVIGLVGYLRTGARRQRFGDRWAKTIVVDARHDVGSKPLTGRHVLWPAVWLAPALVVFVMTADGNTPWSYRAQADRICGAAVQIAAHVEDPAQIAGLARWQADALDGMHVPLNWRSRHDRLMKEYGRLAVVTRTAVLRAEVSAKPRRSLRRSYASIRRRTARAHARLSALGYVDCAGRGEVSAPAAPAGEPA